MLRARVDGLGIQQLRLLDSMIDDIIAIVVKKQLDREGGSSTKDAHQGRLAQGAMRASL